MSIIKLELNTKNIAIAAVVFFVILLMVKLQGIITVFAVSFFIAYLFDPVIDRFEAMRVPRWVSILVLMALGILLVTLLMLWLIPVIVSEIQYLAGSMPDYIASSFKFVQDTAARLHIQFDAEVLKQQAMARAGEAVKLLFTGVSGLVSSVKAGIGIILHIAMIPILVFYFLRDFDRLNEKLFSVLDRKYGLEYRDYFYKFDKILSEYFRGQIIVAFILGLLYTGVLLAVGVKPAVIVGLSAGILSVVPYLGFITGFTSSVILAALQYGDFIHPLFIVAGFAVVQFVEGNFLTPKIVGKSLGLHPTAVIFALLAGGSLFGIAGMIIALPCAAFIRVIAEQKFK